MKISLDLKNESNYILLKNHLFPKYGNKEEVAFLFTKFAQDNNRNYTFTIVDYYLVNSNEFEVQTAYYFELKYEAIVRIIKKAHDLDAGIIEIHSHIGQKYAMFSPTDLSGFNEFVPNILWRLKGKPYSAIVFTNTAFDSLVWFGNINNTKSINIIKAGNLKLKNELTKI